MLTNTSLRDAELMKKDHWNASLFRFFSPSKLDSVRYFRVHDIAMNEYEGEREKKSENRLDAR